MTNDEITLILDGEAWIEYSGHLYEYIGEQFGKHLFSDVNDGDPLTVSDAALHHSTEIYFTYKY